MPKPKTTTEPPVHLMPPVNSGEIFSNETTGGDHSPQNGTPNVRFIGTRRVNGEKERLTEAPNNLISGPDIFSGLPGSAEQIKGFYYERAAELCRAFPGLYKKIVRKGE